MQAMKSGAASDAVLHRLTLRDVLPAIQIAVMRAPGDRVAGLAPREGAIQTRGTGQLCPHGVQGITGADGR